MSQEKNMPVCYFDTPNRKQVSLPSGKLCIFYHGAPQRNPISDPQDIHVLRQHPDMWEVVDMGDGEWAKRSDAAELRRLTRQRNVVTTKDLEAAAKGPVTGAKPEVHSAINPGSPDPLLKAMESEPPLPEECASPDVELQEAVKDLQEDAEEPVEAPMEPAEDMEEEDKEADPQEEPSESQVAPDADASPTEAEAELHIWTKEDLEKQNKAQLADIARLSFPGASFKANATKADMIEVILFEQELQAEEAE